MDTRTKYLGLNLKSPIVVGSCGLTSDVDKMVEMEKAGAGAVVLKSVFEEQIIYDIKRNTHIVAPTIMATATSTLPPMWPTTR